MSRNKCLEGVSILLVDDEICLLELIAEEIGAFGAAVTGASSGNKAFAILRDKRFDVVISDIMMPDGDGFELLTRINSDIRPKPAFLFISGHAGYKQEDLAAA